ncbi:MAG: hypothetical protein IKJ82_02965, partial [Oscillospiraceae bacterium]|nr:hypothetical protein [Oscillospiraceae bacterium]
ANEVHFVREVCLRHDKERFASRIRKANLLHIAQCAMLHIGFSRYFVFCEVMNEAERKFGRRKIQSLLLRQNKRTGKACLFVLCT